MKRKKDKIYSILFFVFLFLLFFFSEKWFDNDLQTNGRYTIGYATGKGWSMGSLLDYEYYVNSEKIKGGAGLNVDYDLYIGKRYFVKFSTKDYGNARILINMPVPDSIRKAPPMGWDTIEFKKLFGEEISN